MLHTIFGILFFGPLIIGLIYMVIQVIKGMTKSSLYRDSVLITLAILAWIGMFVGFAFTDTSLQR